MLAKLIDHKSINMMLKDRTGVHNTGNKSFHAAQPPVVGVTLPMQGIIILLLTTSGYPQRYLEVLGGEPEAQA